MQALCCLYVYLPVSVHLPVYPLIFEAYKITLLCVCVCVCVAILFGFPCGPCHIKGKWANSSSKNFLLFYRFAKMITILRTRIFKSDYSVTQFWNIGHSENVDRPPTDPGSDPNSQN
jgi:ABC-type dipeptide/oligopeptide/nickel transport system permease component